ncbi:hypothetical protein ACFV27_29960 [Streptomyces antimycoticus]|uniref:Uncharacterized protein n=2 Tax=Streptomyces violaceusniger group TaxID=2839105 RepID=A0ABD5JBA2_9ACTN|nr:MULTISPECIES: hypothetical protein [Streptomyces]MEE4585214.1 hypothetical protein [Streptomyces sp. DSM 41602]AJZ82600.1 hypothetical protein AS97_05270 [Streptomyces sp. AgN23]KUL56694.1 hypothetical protein ADL28_21035 [Streptomyces violaceusniger]RSS36479.1 hypothetical protein EF902_35135 [Streptomyces sp. WAC05858]WJD97443.1 hypothetical protein QR300_16425 [Streptomyces antimycoticus]
MSLNDDLTAVQRCLDELVRSVARLEQRVDADGLEIRRVRTDADHLRESLALLRETAPEERSRPDMIPVPDGPYNSALWLDVDDEGLGARDRHAP